MLKRLGLSPTTAVRVCRAVFDHLMVKSAHHSNNKSALRTEFCLLGPVAAWVGGAPVPVGGPRQAAVLARLLLTPRQVVSLDQFIDCVWDEQIPNRPEVAIRSYVSNLRRLLEPERKDRASVSSLVSASAGYRLDIDSEQIDWVRFEHAVNTARSQLKGGLFSDAESSLRVAGGLWQGEPLSGVPESEFFLAYRTRLDELRAVAQELTYEAQLALGDHLSVAADIDQAISTNRFRERLTELGMIALYRSGRQSAALALGQQLRERLVDSRGIDPSPRIASIELQILNHDPALRGQSPPTPATGSGRLSSESSPTGNPKTRVHGTAQRAAELGGENKTSHLIRRPNDDGVLFGRQAELQELDRLAERLRRQLMAVAIVTGEPGIGKTTLLNRAAENLAGSRGRVVRGAGADYTSPKFWLWRQLLDDLIATSAVDSSSLVSMDTSGLEPLQALGYRVTPTGLKPDRSAVPRPTGSPDDDQIMVAIVDLIDRAASDSPLVIIADDLHLADQRSIDTLRYLVTKTIRRPITILAGWQQALLPPEQPRGLRELSVLPHGLRITLRGLDETAVRNLATVRGHNLARAEVSSIHRSAGGNPALSIEMLSSNPSPTGEHPVGANPGITDAVVGQADQIGPDAAWILSVAAIFDGPFALSWLQETTETPPVGAPQGRVIETGQCRDVVRDAVYRGLVTELPEFGWFSFQHQVVRRTLVETLLTVDRAWYHGHFGRRFLHAGDNGHALYHLARGAEQDDRSRALDVGLRLCTSVHRNLPVGDATLKSLETLSREQLGCDKDEHNESHEPSPLACRSALFLGWRAAQRGDRATGRRWAHTAVEIALDRIQQAAGRRGETANPTGEALQDLGAAALNLTGFSPHPQTGGQLNLERDDTTLDLLERAVSLLPDADETLPVLEIELEWLSGSFLPSNASLKKATSLLEQAVKSSEASVSAMATAIYLRRFGRAIAPEQWIERIRSAVTVQSTIGERLMLAFLEHRAMLELGRIDESTALVRSLHGQADVAGNQADTTAARTLAIRHQIWIGDLQVAGQLLEGAMADEPGGADLVAVEVEQGAELGRLLARNDLLDLATEELSRSTVDPATSAALLCQAGHYDRAAHLLEQAVSLVSAGQKRTDEATLARIAVGASILLDKRAAAAVLEPLCSLEDELLVSSNSAVLLGPASYFAGLAAATVGDRDVANEAFDAAVATALSKGGKPLAIQALVAQAKVAADFTDRDDVESLLRQAKELAVGLDIHWLDKQVV